MAIARLVLITLGMILFFYLSHQLTRFAQLNYFELFIVILIVFVTVGSTLAMPLIFWSERGRRLSHQYPFLMLASFYSMSFFSSLIAFVGLRDVVAFIVSFVQPILLDLIYAKSITYLILGVSFLILIWSWKNVQMGARVLERFLVDSRFPKDIAQLKILQISDLHISHFVSREFIESVIVKSNQKKPDLVFLTGDIIDGNVQSLKENIDLLKQLTAKHGVYYVAGNHEYYSNIDECLEIVQSLGIRVLLNNFEILDLNNQKIMIAGVSDPAARMFQKELPHFDNFQRHQDPVDYKILLAHQPSLADRAASSGFHLQFSGHTHGGQFFPWNFLIRLAQKYPKGFYKIKGMHLYVNQGTAYWGPAVRFGTQCEITLLTLSQAARF